MEKKMHLICRTIGHFCVILFLYVKDVTSILEMIILWFSQWDQHNFMKYCFPTSNHMVFVGYLIPWPSKIWGCGMK
jgi:hypothetical protein